MDEKLLNVMTDTIVAELHPDEVILFGSHATGTERACSDVDFLVVMPESEEVFRHRRKLTGCLCRRLAEFPLPKDTLVYTRGEVERWRDVQGHIVSTSLHEGRLLWPQPS